MGKRILKLIKPRPKGGQTIGKFYIVKSDDEKAGKFYARAWRDDELLPFSSPVFLKKESRDDWVDGLVTAAKAA